MELPPGHEAVVRVAVATLWTHPEAVRPVDRPALAAPADVPAWIASLNAEERVGDCVSTQLLLGERVLVTEVRPDGWAHVVAVEQPAAHLDPRGYPGWLPVGQLTATAPLPDTTPMVVDATVTALHHAPHGPVALPGVVLGTRLRSAGPPEDRRLPSTATSAGAPLGSADGWHPVHAPGHADPLWLPAAHVVPLPAGAPTALRVLDVARRLRDVVYVWGGVSTYGIDCSGLVHLVWRRLGVDLPRDATDQAAATTPLRLGTERPGDLYFFARPGRHIHHLGIVTAVPHGDDRRMLHACYRTGRVLEERLPTERTATLVATHRI